MYKYYKKGEQVCAFLIDGSQDEFITSEMVEITPDEIDRAIYPEKYWTDEQKEAHRLSQFSPLTRRQFKLTLLENELLETIESKIELIEDPKQKSRIQIEYLESEKFERTSESVVYMINMLELTAEQVDQMWLHAMSL